MTQPVKKQRKVLFEDGSDDGMGDDGPDHSILKVNKDFASRFEHNKKREELTKLEEKHGKKGIGANRDEESEESTSEEEDDDAEFATEDIDDQIMDTLKAIQTKDPRVYDANAHFYSEPKEGEVGAPKSKEKPMHLRDYHRQNVLRQMKGDEAEKTEEDEEDSTAKPPAVKTFQEEQDELKNAVVSQMHAEVDGDDEDDDGGFLIPKTKPEPELEQPDASSAPEKKKQPKRITDEEVAEADKNPELFLSNFMSARAWLPTEESRFQPFESEDEEDIEAADRFEEAYNLRFEDPNKMNEQILTHSRDAIKKYSVRREEVSGRKKVRDAEKKRKEEERNEREAERARLRKLKIDEAEERLAKIKQAAGLKGSDIRDEDLVQILDDDWNDEKWENFMKKRFGDDYYAQKEDAIEEEAEDTPKHSKKHIKKPKWEDDIDISDLVPDVDADKGGDNIEETNEDGDDGVDGYEDGEASLSKHKSKRDFVKEKKEKQREARKERKKIETLVDQNLNMDTRFLPGASKKNSGFFRYRETSPTSFGLDSRDILLADDKNLNEFAGLKKLAPFREEERKKKDKQKLGKKARLRQWRRDTFGDENGPSETAFEEKIAAARAGNEGGQGEMDGQNGDGEGDVREGSRKKRKRSKKH